MKKFAKKLLNFVITDIIIVSISIVSNVSLLHQNIPLLPHLQILFDPILKIVAFSHINIQVSKMCFFIWNKIVTETHKNAIENVLLYMKQLIIWII